MKLEMFDLINEKIFINGEKININDYLKDITKYYNEILSNDSKVNITITLDKERIESIMLVIIAIQSFFDSLKNSNKKILDELEPDQIVVYKNDKVRYKGREIIYGKEKIILAYEDSRKSRIMINIEDAYKLSIVEGEPSKLSKMTKDRKVYEDSGKFLFSKFIGESIEELSGVIDNQILVVFPSKLYMNELISNIKIEIENVLYDFTQVFPCKYYSDVDNANDFKGNKLKTKELCIFTSRLDISKEIFRTKKECSKLILLGEHTYKNYIDGIFDNLLSRKRLNKIIIHNTYNNIDYIQQVIDREIDVYSWDKQVIEQKSISDDSILSRYLEATTENIIIENDKFNKALFETRRSLIDVLKYSDEIIDKDKFIRLGFSLFNLAQKTVMPLKQYVNYNEENRFRNIIILLKEILDKNKYYSTSKKLITYVIYNLENLNTIFYNENPKLNLLKKIITINDIIVCSTEEEKQYLKQEKFNIITLKEFKKFNCKNKDFIFTCFYNSSLINQLPYGNDYNIKNMLYCTEVIKYNSKIRAFNKSMYSVVEKNKLQSSKYYKKIDLIAYYKNIFNTETININSSEEENEDLIKGYINDTTSEIDMSIYELLDIGDYKNEYLNEEYYSFNSSDVKKQIIYSDGRYSYVTKNFKMLCIKSNGDNVIKTINNLQIGDNVVFVNEKSEEDLFDLFYKIVNSDIFKSRYSKDYENMRYWKIVLKKYVDKYNGDYELVSQELKMHGLTKLDISVRQWINDEKIIGPREKEVYEAIGKVTMDNKLINNWEEIYQSCNRIRRFRTKFKKTFKDMVRMYIMKSFDNKGELENLVIDVFGDLKEYAEIVKVAEIKDVIEHNDIVKVNCLLSK